MVVQTVARRSLEGSLIRLTADANLFTSGETSHLVIEVGSRAVEFEAGGPDFADQVAAWLAIEFTDEFDYEGGVLRIGHTSDRRVPICLAGWIGKQYSLKASVLSITTQGMLNLLEQLSIIEDAEGISLIARPEFSARFPLAGHPPEITQPLDQVGLLEVIPLTPAIVSSLPRWKGLPVPGGELFREDGEDDADTTFLKIGTTTQMRLYPNLSETTLEKAAEEISVLEAEWITP